MALSIFHINLLITVCTQYKHRPVLYNIVRPQHLKITLFSCCFYVNLKGYLTIIGEHIPVRVLGIDAPEIRGKCQLEKVKARKAKQYTVQALRTAKTIELRSIQRGKYFRILADVYVDGLRISGGSIEWH